MFVIRVNGPGGEAGMMRQIFEAELSTAEVQVARNLFGLFCRKFTEAEHYALSLEDTKRVSKELDRTNNW